MPASCNGLDDDWPQHIGLPRRRASRIPLASLVGNGLEGRPFWRVAKYVEVVGLGRALRGGSTAAGLRAHAVTWSPVPRTGLSATAAAACSRLSRYPANDLPYHATIPFGRRSGVGSFLACTARRRLERELTTRAAMT